MSEEIVQDRGEGMHIIQTCHPDDGEDNGGLMPLFECHDGKLLCSAIKLPPAAGNLTDNLPQYFTLNYFGYDW